MNNLRYWSRWWTVTIRHRFSHQLNTLARGWTFPHGLPVHSNTHFQSTLQHRRYRQHPSNTMPKMLKDTPHITSKAIKGHEQHKQPKLATENCPKPVQRKVPSPTCLHPTWKTPLLPTPPAPARHKIRKTLISGPPPCSNSQYDYKQYISGPYSAINNKPHPVLLTNPPHLHTVWGRHRPVITGPHPHCKYPYTCLF